MNPHKDKKITMIDLNNFSYYPTLAIGYLIAVMRKDGFQVKLLSPLTRGVVARPREPIETYRHFVEQRLRHSDNPVVKFAISQVKKVPALFNFYNNKDQIFDVVKQDLPLDTDLILVSSYLENFFVCRQIAKYAQENNIPLIIGGPAFNVKTHAQKWIEMEGVNALVGVEADEFINPMLRDFFDGKDIASYPGVFTKQKSDADTSFVFKKMNETPAPDFTDFPWEQYPIKIIPYLTARGCAWNQCNFCTDITYANGRTFRTQKAEKVMSELQLLSERHHTGNFHFLDLKLNSDLSVWNALIDDFPKYVKNPKWACGVHVDSFKENGLDHDSIHKAKEAGMLRITFGFESGSQRLLNHMKKGTKLERIIDFIKNVHAARISLRGTMFLGYPYETEDDVRQTYEFLEEYGHCFDRVGVATFGIFRTASIFRQVQRDFDKLDRTEYNDCFKVRKMKNPGKKYSYYKRKILKLVHEINRSPLIEEASDFEGVM